MKRSQPKTLDESARKLKKHRIAIAPLSRDPFDDAMRAACVRKGEPLSNQPLIVNALDSDCWRSAQVAYWPANAEIGYRVFNALYAEDGLHQGFLAQPKIHLIMAFMSFEKYAKRLCKLLRVTDVSELGVLRHVGRGKSKTHVDGELLDRREFRLDVQY